MRKRTGRPSAGVLYGSWVVRTIDDAVARSVTPFHTWLQWTVRDEVKRQVEAMQRQLDETALQLERLGAALGVPPPHKPTPPPPPPPLPPQALTPEGEAAVLRWFLNDG